MSRSYGAFGCQQSIAHAPAPHIMPNQTHRLVAVIVDNRDRRTRQIALGRTSETLFESVIHVNVAKPISPD